MSTITNRLFFNRARQLAVLALSLLLLALPLQAAPPPGKGGGKGGGDKGGDGGGAVPEMHHLWRVQMPGVSSAVRPAVAPDGTIYAVDSSDNLIAVSPDGTVQWTAENAGSKGVDISGDGETIYTGNESWIKAFNKGGSLKWTFMQTPRAFVLIDVAVGPDDNIYAVASSGMGVFALEDLGDEARELWRTPEVYARKFIGYTEIEFGPASNGQDSQLYFHANAHTRAVRLDGTPVFTIGDGNTPPRVNRVTGDWHRPAAAYDPDTNPMWTFDFPLATGTREPTLGASGTHYAVNSGYVLYAIDTAGNEDWQATLDEFVGLPDVDPTESQILMDTQATQTHPAALLAVSAQNGSPLWRMEFPVDESGIDQFVDSGVAFDADGTTAYVMTANLGRGNAYLNAIDTDPTLPSASTILRSADISFSARSSRKGVKITGNVTVMDENRAPVSGATVTATWTNTYDPSFKPQTQTVTSGGGGVATFSASGDGGVYYLTVTDMSKDGYTFDPDHGVLTGGQAKF